MKANTKPQQQLLNSDFALITEFGGALLKNSHAQKPRPISCKSPMHLTLRSSQAVGNKSLRRNLWTIRKIESIIRKQAARFKVEIYKYANSGNHLHILVKAKQREGFISFLRAISGLIVRNILGAQKGQSQSKLKTKFWDQRPWTKIILAWTQFLNVRKYVEQNFNEANGLVPYKPRKYKSTA